MNLSGADRVLGLGAGGAILGVEGALVGAGVGALVPCIIATPVTVIAGAIIGAIAGGGSGLLSGMMHGALRDHPPLVFLATCVQIAAFVAIAALSTILIAGSSVTITAALIFSAQILPAVVFTALAIAALHKLIG